MQRVWAPTGHRPVAPLRRTYQCLAVSGFVRPSTGQSGWGLLPTVSVEAMTLALATFARDEGLDAQHRAVLVLDQAGWHTSPKLALPAGIDVVFLPSASPELQPAERLWVLVDEAVANQAFPDLSALEAVLVGRCRTLEADPARLKTHTHYHWWPPEPLPEYPR